MVLEDWYAILGKHGKLWVNALGEDLLLSLDTQATMSQLEVLYAKRYIYPYMVDVFKPFRFLPPKEIKVVILGQDPYPNDASTGLAFANNIALPESITAESIRKLSPALQKIADCVNSEYGHFFDPSLESWAREGVLLLNSALTVERGKPGSHKKLWARFIQEILIRISNFNPGTIFVFWGNEAQKFDLGLNPLSQLLYYTHPASSVYNVSFWDCPNFKQINQILRSKGKEIIDWEGVPF
jgi:uracil-DNA glycosylase